MDSRKTFHTSMLGKKRGLVFHGDLFRLETGSWGLKHGSELVIVPAWPCQSFIGVCEGVWVDEKAGCFYPEEFYLQWQ